MKTKIYNLIFRLGALILCLGAVGLCIAFTLNATQNSAPHLPSDAPANAGVMDIVDVSRAEYTYEELESDLSELKSKYGDKISYRSVGKSLDGRELYAVTVGDAHAPRQLVVTAGVHGREYMTPLLVMRQIEYYLYNYDDFDFWDSYSVAVMPMCNPDGIALAQSGLSAIRSESLRAAISDTYALDLEAKLTTDTFEEYLKLWKANARGVDINRNFDTEDFAGKGTAKQQSFANYAGAFPVSEPETAAMVAFAESLSSPVLALSMHSQGEVIYFNCGQNDQNAAQNFGVAISDHTRYQLMYSERRDSAFEDWCNKVLGVPALTVETGSVPCPLPISEFDRMFEKCRLLWQVSAKYYDKNSH